MALEFKVNTPSFSGDFLKAVESIYQASFSEANLKGLHWRIDNMPDLTIFSAWDKQQIVGFKAGYAETAERYYSWLGGVNPQYQRQGIAKSLMINQHTWLLSSKYKTVETKVNESNQAMIDLNKNSGLVVMGNIRKKNMNYLIMQKNLHNHHN